MNHPERIQPQLLVLGDKIIEAMFEPTKSRNPNALSLFKTRHEDTNLPMTSLKDFPRKKLKLILEWPPNILEFA